MQVGDYLPQFKINLVILLFKGAWADLISACTKSWDLVLQYNQIIDIKVYEIDIRYRYNKYTHLTKSSVPV